MHGGRPSTTALRVALRRAAHQLLDQPAVFEDPLALRILDEGSRAALIADPAASEGGRGASYLRAFLAARSRLAEDEFAGAVARGVRQAVVLGAGLDTFGCRNPHAGAGLVVFEVDHPDTQAWKRERLAAAGLAPPENLRFAPVDFASQDLAHGLAAAGFRADEPAWFSWLGVSMYLDDRSFERTLAYVAARPAPSGIAFDYAVPRETLTEPQRRVFDVMAKRVRAAGEPWIGFHEPHALARRLAAMGYRDTEDLGPEAIHARWFAGRADGLRTGGAAHLAIART